jgi:hypothetical protein
MSHMRRLLHWLARRVTPPGNRGSLETTYQQPNGDETTASCPGAGSDGLRM